MKKRKKEIHDNFEEEKKEHSKKDYDKREKNKAW